tara:strand:- start:393 stop:602 length:210 start_codon:yes stop_codon:yes gene_type:complete
MTSFNRNHRIVIDSYKQCDIAYEWCVEHIPWSEWVLVTDENSESFYFDDEQNVQNFLLLFGGRYYKHGG